ncbi:MAG TPA: hypothetical protein VFO65_13770, partial [Acidimicrobiales bacterium]|nr:hypothetical protein [Acidimicrobiales bacterium]
AALPAADEHAARGPEGTAGGLSHLHASVTPGPARSQDGHDLGGTAHTPGAPALPDPLAGPGTISTLRIGPIPLPPTVPGVEVPHLSPALPFVSPGRVNLLPLAGLPAPCRDCLVLGIRPDLVYADGTPANLDTGPMLHHAVFTEPARPDPVCGRNTLIGQLGHRVFAVGNERTGASLPEGFGVPLGSGPWAGVVELMNGSTELRTVFVEATVRWVPRGTPGIEPVTPVWLDVDSCGDSEVDVGAGPTDIDWEWPSTVTGRIVAAAGHLHDGGTWLGLRNASTGEHVCISVAGYGTDPAYAGSLESMSACAWDRLGTVRAGERLHLRAHYNAASARPGVMGIMLVFVHETGDLAAGTPSPYPADPPPDGRPVDTGHAH